MFKTTLTMDKELFNRLKISSIEEGTTVNKLLTRLTASHLARRDASKKKREEKDNA